MEIWRLDKVINEKIVLALGFFDCVHIGHRKLLLECMSLSKKCKAKSAVFTFDNNPQNFFDGHKSQKLIYDINERCRIFQQIGLDYVVWETFDDIFCQKTPLQFLELLFSQRIVGIVCGFDYTFGKDAAGNVKILSEFCHDKNIPFVEVSAVTHDQKKVSSRSIGEHILKGDIAKANEMLGECYRYTGKVCGGYQIGEKIGFPTANLMLKENVIIPHDGVYCGFCVWSGKRYTALINVGSRPTFCDAERKIEAHLIRFDGNLYGQEITLYFERFLRPQKKFDTTEQLILQLKEDFEKVRL